MDKLRTDRKHELSNFGYAFIESSSYQTSCSLLSFTLFKNQDDRHLESNKCAEKLKVKSIQNPRRFSAMDNTIQHR